MKHARTWRRLGASGICVGMACWALAASAQEIPPGAGSADRPRPEYDPVGIRSGSFFIHPSIRLQPAYDDNVFARDEDPVGDFTLSVAPQIEIESDWGSHRLAAAAYGESVFHADLSREDRTDWGARGEGRLDILRTTSLEVRGGFDRAYEDRENIDTARLTETPIASDRLNGGVRLRHSLNRLDFLVEGRVRRLGFEDGRLIAGGMVDQDFRDRTTFDGLLRATYEFSPGYGGLIQASVNKRDYDLAPGDAEFDPAADFNRDSEGYEIEAGLAFEITRLLYGNVRGGYIRQNFESPVLPDVDGFGFGAGLLWNVTTLTSVRLDGDRRVEDTTTRFSGGRLTSEISLGIDHELLRNLIITLHGTYRRQDFRGIDRADDYVQGGARIRYLLTRELVADLRYRYTTRDSSAGVQEFSRNLVQMALTFRM